MTRPPEPSLPPSVDPVVIRAAEPKETARSGLVAAIQIVVAAIGFGCTFPAVKWVFGDRPLFGAGWIYLSSGLALTLLALVRPRSKEPPLRRRDLPWLAGAVVSGGIVAPIAQMQGLALLPAHVGSLLSNVEIVFTALLALAFFGERLSGRRWVGMAALLGGGVLCAGALDPDARTGEASLWGFLWFALAGLAWGLDNNLTRRIADRDAFDITRWKGLVGGSCSLLAAVLYFGWPAGMGPRVWVWGTVVGIVGYGLSLVLFIRGLRRYGAARATAVLVVVSTFVGVIGSAAFLGEHVSPWIAVAGVLIVLGTVLVTAGVDGDAKRG